MDSSSKRRKLNHGGSSQPRNGLIDFESRQTARVSMGSIFVLQTDELLKEARLNPEKALKGIDARLDEIKGIINSIKPHDPIPVGICGVLCDIGSSL